MPDKTSDEYRDVAPEFSFPIDVTSLTPTGRTYSLKASAEERERVAARLGLQEVSAFTTALEAKFIGGGMFKVTGRIKAELVQTCVVSLAPVPATIDDAVSATFITEESAEKERARREKAKARAKARGTEEDEEELDLSGDDPPEVARANRIDLGEVAVVHLALALNPYPRAPGAAFSPEKWGMEPEEAEKPATVSPFAALAALKKAKKGGPGGARG